MIELKNLSKTFRLNADQVTALDQVSLTVRKGEIFGVIGKSGAGKSTLIRCVNLLERPSEGEVIVAGQQMLDLSQDQLRQARHQIGMVFQHFNLLSSKNVFDNVALPLVFMKKEKKAIKETVISLLKMVGLQDKMYAYPSQLSGGQKQRVAIARALATKPKILLCDEMTSALDPETTQSILDLVQEINSQMHLTILLITHEMEVIKRICDKVAVLDSGRVIEQGEVVKVFRSPEQGLTKKLMQSAFHLELPKILQEKIQSHPVGEGYTLLRISFVGESAVRPLMNELVLKFNLLVNILQSNLEMLHTKPIGMMIVAVSGETVSITQAIEHMGKHDLTVEVVGYVKRNNWNFS